MDVDIPPLVTVATYYLTQLVSATTGFSSYDDRARRHRPRLEVGRARPAASWPSPSCAVTTTSSGTAFALAQVVAGGRRCWSTSCSARSPTSGCATSVQPLSSREGKPVGDVQRGGQDREQVTSRAEHRPVVDARRYTANSAPTTGCCSTAPVLSSGSLVARLPRHDPAHPGPVKPDAVRRGLVGEVLSPVRGQGPHHRGARAAHDRRASRPTRTTPSTSSATSTRRCATSCTSGPLVALVARGRRGDRGGPRAQRRHRRPQGRPGHHPRRPVASQPREPRARLRLARSPPSARSRSGSPRSLS